MAVSKTLEAARAHLEFWKQECDVAQAANDPVRIARCEKFIAQCESIIAALQGSQNGLPSGDARRRATR